MFSKILKKNSDFIERQSSHDLLWQWYFYGLRYGIQDFIMVFDMVFKTSYMILYMFSHTLGGASLEPNL